MSSPFRAPLSQMQTQLWAVQTLFPGSAVHNTAWLFDLGPVDVDRFGRAFDDLVRRADALRMVIDDQGDVPQVRVQEVGDTRLVVEDVPMLQALDLALDARALTPLDPCKKTMDSVLYRMPDGNAVWLLNLHHIVNDGASGPVLFEALAASYDAGPDVLPELPSFAAHLIAHRVNETDQAFWTAWRQSAPALPRLYGQTLTGTNITAVERRLTLSADQSAALTDLSKAKGFASLSASQSVFQIFQTVLMAWMHRTSGEDHLALGVATHGRGTPQTRRMAGCFVDIFPVDARLAPQDSFRDLHGKLRAANMASLRHASPGSLAAKGMARFSAVLNAFPVRFCQFDGHDISATWLGNGCTDPTHALRLNLIDDAASGLTLKFLFNTDVIAERDADIAVAHLLALLDAMTADPDAVITAIPLAQPGEASARLMAPPAPTADLPDISAVVDRLEAEQPEATAVIDDAGTWTRRDLGDRTNAIAAMLQSHDVGPGARVGIHLTRGGPLIASLLAVLKVGATFVPLDPGQPAGRLDAIAAEAQLALVLTEPDIARHWPEAVATADVTDVPMAQYTVDREAQPRAAYVLFTSGSTGRPKGVQVGRAALSRYAAWSAKTFGGTEPASWALHSAIGFDLTLTSIFAPLVSGGVIRAYRDPLDGPDLSIMRVFADDGANVVKLTPSHLNLALEAGKPLTNIRALVLGGEELTTALCRNTLATFGAHLTIHNEYGPTEATVGCMDHIFDPARDTDATAPIGRPATATQITVRDAALNPVPDRVLGELYVTGQDRLADGYFGNAAATKEVFVTDPHSGARLYRTRDLASVRPDGVILYHGRADDQLKVSGIRIERGEIANAVREHPSVSNAHLTTFDPMARPEEHCPTCGISNRVPEVSFGADGQCGLCQDFDRYRSKANAYFGQPDELARIVADAQRRKTGIYDCVILLSGGKDSTYAVAKMAEVTRNMLCVTLDNGYIAEDAKANIVKITRALGLDHRFLTTPDMNDIFVDSLKRHSNVCQGCFKTIYTLALDVAREVGAPMIVTGLSRGQLFETRLAPELFGDASRSTAEIDDIVLEARRTYHAYPDTVSKRLNGDLFQTGDILSEISFVDFYRYVDVPVSEVYRYLKETVGWVRPADTGRSSNCLINDVGIFVHKAQRRHHNYALPYSWDVRMGHKTVSECLDELNDEIDEGRVRTILDEIGYDSPVTPETSGDLTCYYVSQQGLSPRDLRQHLATRLPREVIPKHLIPVDQMPLSANGKVDAAKLPDPRQRSSKIFAAPAVAAAKTGTEAQLLEVWRTVLGHADITVDDNFYDIGGSSIGAIQIAAQARSLGIELSPVDIFRAQTVAALSAIVGAKAGAAPAKPKTRAKVASADQAKLAALLGKS